MKMYLHYPLKKIPLKFSLEQTYNLKIRVINFLCRDKNTNFNFFK